MKYYYNTDVSITDTKTSYNPPLFKSNIPSTECDFNALRKLLISFIWYFDYSFLLSVLKAK
jgi:hypothetical protein